MKSQSPLQEVTDYQISNVLTLVRAELGRAAWKLFHTTFARFPDKPTDDESLALKSYLHLFQRLYPWYVRSMNNQYGHRN